MFDLFINQDMRNIRRQHHISKEVILDWSAFVNVQDSHPYVAIGKISAETRRFFVALVMPLSVQILFRPTIADLAIGLIPMDLYLCNLVFKLPFIVKGWEPLTTLYLPFFDSQVI